MFVFLVVVVFFVSVVPYPYLFGDTNDLAVTRVGLCFVAESLCLPTERKAADFRSRSGLSNLRFDLLLFSLVF